MEIITIRISEFSLVGSKLVTMFTWSRPNGRSSLSVAVLCVVVWELFEIV